MNKSQRPWIKTLRVGVSNLEGEQKGDGQARCLLLSRQYFKSYSGKDEDNKVIREETYFNHWIKKKGIPFLLQSKLLL